MVSTLKEVCVKSRSCPITATLTVLLAAGVWGCPPPQATRGGDSGRDSDGAAAAQASNDSGGGDRGDEGNGKAIFPEPVHDFGEVEQGKAVSHLFKVKNGGEDVLHIKNVRGS